MSLSILSVSAALAVVTALPLDVNVIRGNSINNTFGMVRNQGRRAHQGWDFSAEVGTPVYAICDYVKMQSGHSKDYGYWFQYESIRSGYIYFVAHLKRPIFIREQGLKGEIVGYVGKTGNASNVEPHLHFEMRTMWNPGLGLNGRVSPANTFGSWTNYLGSSK